jgi:hypothetical protein
MHGLGIRTSAVALGCGALSVLLSGCVLLYTPPQPPGAPQGISREELIGTWRDEQEGSITFSAAGTFVAEGVCGDYWDFGNEVPAGVDRHYMTASGAGAWVTFTWTPGSESRPVTEVSIEFAESRLDAQYQAGGTVEAPKLWVYMGDLDNYDLCVLTKQL